MNGEGPLEQESSLVGDQTQDQKLTPEEKWKFYGCFIRGCRIRQSRIVSE